jgi:hypothetical protein
MYTNNSLIARKLSPGKNRTPPIISDTPRKSILTHVPTLDKCLLNEIAKDACDDTCEQNTFYHFLTCQALCLDKSTCSRLGKWKCGTKLLCTQHKNKCDSTDAVPYLGVHFPIQGTPLCMNQINQLIHLAAKPNWNVFAAEGKIYIVVNNLTEDGYRKAYQLLKQSLDQYTCTDPEVMSVEKHDQVPEVQGKFLITDSDTETPHRKRQFIMEDA